MGNVDAQVTAPAARAVEPGQFVAIMGTSTCHVMSGPELHEVPGMCGMDVFEDFAEMARTELLTIDEDTTIRQFKKDLDWNAAYYKLAGGL